MRVNVRERAGCEVEAEESSHLDLQQPLLPFSITLEEAVLCPL